MTERIDHAKRALEAIEYIEAEAVWMEYAPHATAVATAHATLALVEQQRIANLINLAGFTEIHQATQVQADAREGLATYIPHEDPDMGGWPEMRVEVREALGLD